MLYVPILKCKKGEKEAIYQLSESVKEHITPLFELTPDIIEKNGNSGIPEYWEKKEYFFDISPESYIDLTDEEHIELIKENNKSFVTPVVRLTDSNEKVTEITDWSQNGIALRISIEEIMEEEFSSIYEEFIDYIRFSESFLIIDVKDFDPEKINETLFLLRGAFDFIENLEDFKAVIVSSNSFPESLKVDKKEITSLPRGETKLFDKLKKLISVDIIYSDYCINHWTYFEFIPGMQPSFNIRYTTEKNYVVYKGDTVKRGGLNIDKVVNACELLVESPHFYGENYSWGDKEIYAKGKGEIEKPGSLTTWRSIGTNHHITFIVNLLSNQTES